MNEYQTIERDRLRHWVNGDKTFVLINVLPKEGFEERHLPGSVNVDLSQKDFLKKVEEVAKDKEVPIVVYCHAGSSSPKAADKLVRAGYKEVYDYEGGMDDWEDAGYPFEVEGQQVYL